MDAVTNAKRKLDDGGSDDFESAAKLAYSVRDISKNCVLLSFTVNVLVIFCIQNACVYISIYTYMN